jgi:hypothetical protein
MKERGIIMQGESVLGILEGRKSQTRRVIKPQPTIITDQDHFRNYLQIHGRGVWFEGDPNKTCPYGQPGDRPWVRETFCDLGAGDNRIIYKASFDDLTAEMMRQSGHGTPIWKPSIFMPRWASRITLEIVNVRVERVQDISEEDAKAEGVTCPSFINPRQAYYDLWDSINAERGYGWDVNPYVWVIEFKVLP